MFTHKKVLQLCYELGNHGDPAARLSCHTVLCHNKMHTPANSLAQRRVKLFPGVREGNLPHPTDIKVEMLNPYF